MGLIIKTEVPEMEMKKTCDVCGKEAIGMQIMGAVVRSSAKSMRMST